MLKLSVFAQLLDFQINSQSDVTCLNIESFHIDCVNFNLDIIKSVQIYIRYISYEIHKKLDSLSISIFIVILTLGSIFYWKEGNNL